MAQDGLASDAMGMPSEAELEQMLAHMREAPVEQVIVEVVNVLLQAAQVKLGRPDARVLIDGVAALAEVATGRIDAALVGQVAQAVAKLRLAQVEAEGGSSPAPADTAPAGSPAAPADPAAQPPGSAARRPSGAPTAPQTPGEPGDTGAAQRSRLWVPGR
jgi:hypothetical protein